MDLFTRPKNTFVAKFIGAPQINLIDGEVIEEGGQRFVRHSTGLLAIPEGLRGEVGRKVSFGIRPEHLSIVDSSGFSCLVRLIEPMGSETLVVAESGDQTLEIMVRDENIVVPKPGERIKVAPLAGKPILFDQRDGSNLEF